MQTLPCSLCGTDVTKVGDEALSVVCSRCAMAQAEFENSKATKPLTALFSVDAIVEMLENKRIAVLRERLNISERAMAKKLGLTRPAYARIESSKHTPQKLLAKARQHLELEEANSVALKDKSYQGGLTLQGS